MAKGQPASGEIDAIDCRHVVKLILARHLSIYLDSWRFLNRVRLLPTSACRARQLQEHRCNGRGEPQTIGANTRRYIAVGWRRI